MYDLFIPANCELKIAGPMSVRLTPGAYHTWGGYGAVPDPQPDRTPMMVPQQVPHVNPVATPSMVPGMVPYQVPQTYAVPAPMTPQAPHLWPQHLTAPQLLGMVPPPMLPHSQPYLVPSRIDPLEQQAKDYIAARQADDSAKNDPAIQQMKDYLAAREAAEHALRVDVHKRTLKAPAADGSKAEDAL